MRWFRLAVQGCAVVLIALFVGGGSCNGTPPYYIRFTISGTEYEFSQGVSNVSEYPFGHVAGTGTIMCAAPDRGPDLTHLPADYVIITFPDTTTGTFTITTRGAYSLFRCDHQGVAYFADNGEI